MKTKKQNNMDEMTNEQEEAARKIEAIGKTVYEIKMINTQSLKDVAIYLSGVKDGKGNLIPLGTIVLDDLWDTIKYLQGDVMFMSERDVKIK